MSTQEFTNVEALRQQCTNIRQLATDALSGAIKRRDAVLAEVRQEEQRLAAVVAERRSAEDSLSTIRGEIDRLTRELELFGAELLSPSVADLPTPPPSVADESLSIVQDEMERLTRELELLGADLTPAPTWAGSVASALLTRPQ